MFAYLEGIFVDKSPAQINIDVNGIGYEVNISLHTYSLIQNLDKGKLYTYLQIKENEHTLYGFFDKVEKEMFVLLIGVSGIGAATARMMLSSLKPDELSKAILQNDVKTLENIKGIGKKTAERLVLELKDKIMKYAAVGIPTLQVAHKTVGQDALNALTALGISKLQAEQAIQKIINTEPNTISLEDLIKKSLKAI